MMPPNEPNFIYNLKIGLAILASYAGVFLAMFFVAKKITSPDIPEQKQGPLEAISSEAKVDYRQQREILRLHEVDVHTDRRLDRMEALQWALAALGALAALAQIWDVVKGAFK